jgi:hypothetical protein
VREGGEEPTEEREKNCFEIGEIFFFEIRVRKKTKEKKLVQHGLRQRGISHIRSTSVGKPLSGKSLGSSSISQHSLGVEKKMKEITH